MVCVYSHQKRKLKIWDNFVLIKFQSQTLCSTFRLGLFCFFQSSAQLSHIILTALPHQSFLMLGRRLLRFSWGFCCSGRSSSNGNFRCWGRVVCIMNDLTGSKRRSFRGQGTHLNIMLGYPKIEEDIRLIYVDSYSW